MIAFSNKITTTRREAERSDFFRYYHKIRGREGGGVVKRTQRALIYLREVLIMSKLPKESYVW